MLPFLLPALSSLGGSLLGKFFGGGSGQPAMPSPTQQRYDSALQNAGTRGNALESEGDKRLLNFDPKAMLKDTITGYANQNSEQLHRDLDTAAGKAAGAGRLDTGFYDLDKGDLIRQSNNRLQDVIAQTAGQATQLTADNNRAIEGAGQEANSQYNDLITGQLDREQAQRNANQQSRSSNLGAVATLAGDFLGSKTGGDLLQQGLDFFGRKKKTPYSGYTMNDSGAE